jgi:hypothetical protein
MSALLSLSFFTKKFLEVTPLLGRSGNNVKKCSQPFVEEINDCISFFDFYSCVNISESFSCLTYTRRDSSPYGSSGTIKDVQVAQYNGPSADSEKAELE